MIKKKYLLRLLPFAFIHFSHYSCFCFGCVFVIVVIAGYRWLRHLLCFAFVASRSQFYSFHSYLLCIYLFIFRPCFQNKCCNLNFFVSQQVEGEALEQAMLCVCCVKYFNSYYWILCLYCCEQMSVVCFTITEKLITQHSFRWLIVGYETKNNSNRSV